MVRHKRGGADEAFADPAVDAALDGMVDAALASSSKGGARGRRPSVAFQSSSQPLVPSDSGDSPAPAPVVAAPAVAPVVVAEPGVLKKGLTNLMKDISADVKNKVDSTSQMLVDGLAVTYRAAKVVAGVGAMGLIGKAAPPTIEVVMGMGRTLIEHLPRQSWNDIYETWKGPFAEAGSTASSAAEFATTPGGALMLGGLLIGAAARGAGKSVPEYLKDISVTTAGTVGEKVKAVIGNIKTELDRVATKSPAADLNAEVKARLQKKATQEAADAYLAMAEEKAAAEVLRGLSSAPVGGRRRKGRKTKKRGIKRRVTRRFVY